MKMDERYSSIFICPTTKEQIDSGDLHFRNGVCPRCGDVEFAICHHTTIVGRWNMPGFLERWKGVQPEFFPKSEEDALINALKGDQTDA